MLDSEHCARPLIFLTWTGLFLGAQNSRVEFWNRPPGLVSVLGIFGQSSLFRVYVSHETSKPWPSPVPQALPPPGPALCRAGLGFSLFPRRPGTLASVRSPAPPAPPTGCYLKWMDSQCSLFSLPVPHWEVRPGWGSCTWMSNCGCPVPTQHLQPPAAQPLNPPGCSSHPPPPPLQLLRVCLPLLARP